eukprot:jgi/Orpsp1_1/1181309/evm.model.c7180000076714.1
MRSINRKFPQDINTFDEIPEESEFYKTCNEYTTFHNTKLYKTKRNEKFMIFKNSSLIIFQSPFQANLLNFYSEDIFADGTFYAAPKMGKQIFITRIYSKELNCFYTTSFAILKNKNQETYIKLFEEIKKNSMKFNNNIDFKPKNFHCDFEIGISNAAKIVFPDINI